MTWLIFVTLQERLSMRSLVFVTLHERLSIINVMFVTFSRGEILIMKRLPFSMSIRMTTYNIVSTIDVAIHLVEFSFLITWKSLKVESKVTIDLTVTLSPRELGPKALTLKYYIVLVTLLVLAHSRGINVDVAHHFAFYLCRHGCENLSLSLCYYIKVVVARGLGHKFY